MTGLWGSIVNAIALTLIQNANQRGPLGPVAAIGAMYSPLLVVVEALKQHKGVSMLELVGLLAGTYGALLMVIP